MSVKKLPWLAYWIAAVFCLSMARGAGVWQSAAEGLIVGGLLWWLFD